MSEPDRGGSGGLTLRVAWIVFGCFVCQLGLGYGYVFGPLLTGITEELGLSRAEFSSSRVATTLTMAMASPLVGWLAVRVGTRAVVVVSALLIVLTYGLLSRAQGLADLYVGYGLLGIFTTGLGDIVMGGVVAQWITRGRGLALGIVYTGSNIGANVFVAVATYVAATQSWREALLTIGLGGAAVILPFALGVVRDRPGASPDELAALRPEAEGASITTADALRTRTFWIFWFALLVFFLYFLAVLDHFVATLEDVGTSNADASWWFRVAILMGLVSKVGMGVFADALSGRLAFVVNQVLLTLSSLLLLLLDLPAALPLFVLLFGFSYAARDVVYPLIVGECFGVRNLAPIYGLLMTVLLPASMGGIFAGWIFDRFGSYDVAYGSFAALNVVVLISLAFVRRELPAGASYTAAP